MNFTDVYLDIFFYILAFSSGVYLYLKKSVFNGKKNIVYQSGLEKSAQGVNCWSDFYKYVKRRKGNKENIPAIKDCNGRIFTDAIEKANTFNSYYSTVFSSEGNILHIQSENTDDPFTTDIKTIRRKIKATGKNKSVGPDRVSGEILKLGWEAMFPYLARLLDITMNNGTLPDDWKRATVILFTRGAIGP